MVRDVDITSPMNPVERRGVFGLAGIFGLRMLGLFMILPVLSLLTEDLRGATPFMMGLAISAYGLTQAIFQIPFGMLSDRFGRKLIITVGLTIFAAGSVIAALSDSIVGVILGRALQGSGAIAAATMALVADLTREVHRTKAMALIGISIGISFALSMVAGPIIAGSIGLQGLFWVTAVLAVSGLLVLLFVVPNPENLKFHRDAETHPGDIRTVLANFELLRLDFGILILHMIMTAGFVVYPLLLRDAGLPVFDHWMVYLPVLLVSMILVIPAIVFGEKKRKIKPVFIASIAVIAFSDAGFYLFHDSIFSLAVFLLMFFCGFNLLEATLPSLISKIAPVNIKGTAMGVYSTSQFFGAFVGGAGGGWLYGKFGVESVFLACSTMALCWFFVALTMQPPRHLSSLLLNVGELDENQAERMSEQIADIAGVAEAIVPAYDGVAYLKVDKEFLDYNRLQQLVPQDA